jgi:hypothetical protein
MDIKELAEKHWNEYVEPLLRVHGEKDDVIAKCRFHYVSSAIHFAKHIKEETDGK